MKTLADWKGAVVDLRGRTEPEFKAAYRFACRKVEKIERVIFKGKRHEKGTDDNWLNDLLGDIGM